MLTHRFSKGQLGVFAVGSFLFALSCVVVPWRVSSRSKSHQPDAPLNYSTIFSPPTGVGAVVDWSRLFLGWGMIAGGVGFLTVLSERKPR